MPGETMSWREHRHERLVEVWLSMRHGDRVPRQSRPVDRSHRVVLNMSLHQMALFVRELSLRDGRLSLPAFGPFTIDRAAQHNSPRYVDPRRWKSSPNGRRGGTGLSPR